VLKILSLVNMIALSGSRLSWKRGH